jgi:hypothetical protein
MSWVDGSRQCQGLGLYPSIYDMAVPWFRDAQRPMAALRQNSFDRMMLFDTR